MELKYVRVRGKALPAKGLLTLLGSCALLITFAIDFTYGK